MKHWHLPPHRITLDSKSREGFHSNGLCSSGQLFLHPIQGGFPVDALAYL